MFRGLRSSIFPRKTVLSLHFTDSKSECPGYPQVGAEDIKWVVDNGNKLLPIPYSLYDTCLQGIMVVVLII